MNKIIRYWNQNREKIIIIIAIIAFIFIIITVIDNLLENNNYSKNNTSINKMVDVTKPNISAITGQKISEKETKINTDLIKKFVNYCNNQEIQKAYDLLSSDCKENFKNDVNLFRNNYYNKVFDTQKTYSLEVVGVISNAYTYKITYYKDNLLATGGISKNNTEDYITIIKEVNEEKINISSFIKKENINKTKLENNIEISIKSKEIYKSYEIYNLTIKNNTQNIISISDGENNSDIYLTDKNGTKYNAFVNEIPIYNLALQKGQQISLEIKFNKIYDTYRKIEKIYFENIKLESEGKEKIKIIVEI